MDRQLAPGSDYTEKLIKLIPVEIVAAYLAIAGLASQTSPTSEFHILVASVCVLLVLIPFYAWRVSGVRSFAQIGVMMVSFIVWIASMGGPFLNFAWYEKAYGAVALILWTIVAPLFEYGAQ